jgi:hypothetical protein
MSNNGNGNGKPVGLTAAEERVNFQAAPPPDDKKTVQKDTQLCVACGRYHGGTTRWLNCLSAKVLELRRALRLHDGASKL